MRRLFLTALFALICATVLIAEDQIRLRKQGVLGTPEVIPDEICSNSIDDDLDGLIDEGCGGPPPEICGNGIDDDGDGQIDEGCPTEICNNGIDDDGDGLIDEGCPLEICGNGIDDDGDGQIDEGCPVLDPELLEQSDLTYLGAFRVPSSGCNVTGQGLAYNPTNNSLFITCQGITVAEITIPAAVNTTNASLLNQATYLQSPVDPTEGRMLELWNGGDLNVQVGGLLVDGSNLYVTGFVYYDAGGSQQLSHWRRSKNLTAGGTLQGPYSIIVCEFFGCIPGAGIVSGYMTPIPSAYQGALGGTAITGQCCIPIITRTSYGPSALAFTPVNFPTSVQHEMNLYYDTFHQTIGTYSGPANDLYNGPTQVRGIVFPENTRSILFWGRHGTGDFCYGFGVNQNPPPVHPDPNEHNCYDPVISDKGNHAYPYHYQTWAYDVQELIDVKNHLQQQYEPTPYAFWRWPTLPFGHSTGEFDGAAYDPNLERLYVSMHTADPLSSGAPIIHVFQLPTP